MGLTFLFHKSKQISLQGNNKREKKKNDFQTNYETTTIS